MNIKPGLVHRVSFCMKFSVIIPAYNEEKFITKCLESIEKASVPYPDQVEIVVVINRCTDKTEGIARAHGAKIVYENAKNLSKIRNAGAKASCGDILLTIDADSRMTDNMLIEIDRHMTRRKYIGGGTLIFFDRLSTGIVLTSLMVAVRLMLRDMLSGGLFWCRREDFFAVGGFDENMITLEDFDFAKRLKRYGKSRGKRFKAIKRAWIKTSSRKFDKFGDWYLIKNPELVKGIISGRDQEAADKFFYDFER